jgi:putative ABC transport system substrate-binding protein
MLINVRGRIMRRRRFVFGLLSISALAPGLRALRAQQPSRLRRVVNLKSAKALDIVVPATILARADEVME